MRPLLARLAGGEVLLADGAMGTMLLDRGLAPGTAPETVTLAHPETLEQVAQLYLDAGADLLETNTFGASPLKLALHGLEAHAEAINRESVAAVRRVTGNRANVIGSCGPSGRLLEPFGDTSPDAMYDSFHRQMVWLVGAGVDGMCVETMTDLTEATLAVRAAKTVAPTLPVIATMTFDQTPRGYFTVMGVSIAAAASRLEEAGADVVGSNCGNGIEQMVAIAREFRRHTELPLAIQANAGLPRMVRGKAVYDETPDMFAARVSDLLDVGVSVIGGCCGTTPDHVRALRQALDALAR